MKRNLTIFVANRFKNNLMKMADLKPDYKWFAEAHDVTFEGKAMNAKKIMNLINKSENDLKDYWIPAILYKDKLYAHKSVKSLSDGKKQFFLTREIGN